MGGRRWIPAFGEICVTAETHIDTILITPISIFPHLGGRGGEDGFRPRIGAKEGGFETRPYKWMLGEAVGSGAVSVGKMGGYVDEILHSAALRSE